MRKRNLHGTLIKNYVVFVIIMLAAAALSMMFLGIMLTRRMEGEDFPSLTADQAARPDYEQIDITEIDLVGGWAEILDRTQGIYVKGDKDG